MEQENNNLNENQEQTVMEEPVVTEEPIKDNVEAEIIAEKVKKSSGKYKVIIGILIVLLIGAGIFIYFMLNNKEEKPVPKPADKPTEENKTETEEEDNGEYLAYQIKGNSITDFDLQFLKLEDKKDNVIYSPLSIKYALEMLKDGANGKTKEQIERIVGTYAPKKYQNNANMSFANAMFIKDSYKKFIKDTYVNALSKDYNASVIYDSFQTPDKVNKWISDKTFKLINGLLEDISSKNFILVNALAIDMDWVNKIQERWDISFDHENYYLGVADIEEQGFEQFNFQDVKDPVVALNFAATANRYDIVKVLGENKIRKTVGDDYQAWLDAGAENSCYDPEYSDESEKDPDRETYVNNYIKEINKNYGTINSSTDFSFYVDSNVKVFAKDLKKYGNTTLQYIAIMPTKVALSDYVKTLNAIEINKLISNTKSVAAANYKEGVITEIEGSVPAFYFDYELNLIKDLNKLGITHAFDPEKADLSNMSTERNFVEEATHKATIDFSNEGIKAAAVTLFGMGGGGECGYDYLFEPPVEKIDLKFNKPFIFLIVDKDTKEVWFAGSIYKPADYKSYLKKHATNYDEFFGDEDN